MVTEAGVAAVAVKAGECNLGRRGTVADRCSRTSLVTAPDGVHHCLEVVLLEGVDGGSKCELEV